MNGKIYLIDVCIWERSHSEFWEKHRMRIFYGKKSRICDNGVGNRDNHQFLQKFTNDWLRRIFCLVNKQNKSVKRSERNRIMCHIFPDWLIQFFDWHISRQSNQMGIGGQIVDLLEWEQQVIDRFCSGNVRWDRCIENAFVYRVLRSSRHPLAFSNLNSQSISLFNSTNFYLSNVEISSQ